MSIFIEAIYEDGVFRPLAHYQLKEHRHYRLMLVEEILTSDLSSENSADSVNELSHCMMTLPDGRNLVNLSGLFANYQLDLSFDEIETILDKFRQEQEREWDNEQEEQKNALYR